MSSTSDSSTERKHSDATWQGGSQDEITDAQGLHGPLEWQTVITLFIVVVIVCPVLTLTFHGLQCMFVPGVHVRVRELKIIVSSTCKALKSAMVVSARHTSPFIEILHSKCPNRYQFTSRPPPHEDT